MTPCREKILSVLLSMLPGAMRDLTPETDSDNMSLLPTENSWVLPHIQNNVAAMFLCNSRIWCHFRFAIMEGQRGHFWSNQNGLHLSSIGWCVSKNYIPDRHWLLELNFSEVRCDMCRFCVFFFPLHSHMCTLYDKGVSSRSR